MDRTPDTVSGKVTPDFKNESQKLDEEAYKEAGTNWAYQIAAEELAFFFAEDLDAIAPHWQADPSDIFRHTVIYITSQRPLANLPADNGAFATQTLSGRDIPSERSDYSDISDNPRNTRCFERAVSWFEGGDVGSPSVDLFPQFHYPQVKQTESQRRVAFASQARRRKSDEKMYEDCLQLFAEWICEDTEAIANAYELDAGEVFVRAVSLYLELSSGKQA